MDETSKYEIDNLGELHAHLCFCPKCQSPIRYVQADTMKPTEHSQQWRTWRIDLCIVAECGHKWFVRFERDGRVDTWNSGRAQYTFRAWYLAARNTRCRGKPIRDVIKDIQEDIAMLEREEAAREQVCYVYFLSAPESNVVKIGRSINPAKRIAALQAQSPCQLVLRGAIVGDETVERKAHELLAPYRHHGEWFSAVPEVQKSIARWLAGDISALRDDDDEEKTVRSIDA